MKVHFILACSAFGMHIKAYSNTGFMCRAGYIRASARNPPCEERHEIGGLLRFANPRYALCPTCLVNLLSSGKQADMSNFTVDDRPYL